MTTYTVTDLRNEYNEAMKAHEENNGYFPVLFESLRASQNIYKMSVFFHLGEAEYQALMTAYYAWQSRYAGGGWGDHARGNPLPTCPQFCEVC